MTERLLRCQCGDCDLHPLTPIFRPDDPCTWNEYEDNPCPSHAIPDTIVIRMGRDAIWMCGTCWRKRGISEEVVRRAEAQVLRERALSAGQRDMFSHDD